MTNRQKKPRISIALVAAAAVLACACAVINAIGGETLLSVIWGVAAALNVVSAILRVRMLKKSGKDTDHGQETL